MFELVAVGGSAVALPRVLDLAAPGLAAQLLDLELVEGLNEEGWTEVLAHVCPHVVVPRLWAQDDPSL